MKKARLNTWQVKFSVQLRMMQNFTSWGSPLETLIKFKMININVKIVHVKIIIITYSKLDIFFLQKLNEINTVGGVNLICRAIRAEIFQIHYCSVLILCIKLIYEEICKPRVVHYSMLSSMIISHKNGYWPYVFCIGLHTEELLT